MYRINLTPVLKLREEFALLPHLLEETLLNFSKQQLSKMLNLNEEFMSASPARRKEIEQEIIDMVPKSDYAGDKNISELSQLQSDLKDKINALGACASRSDLIGFFQQIEELDQKIRTEASRLGTDLNKVDYGSIMNKMLEAKFGR